MILSKSVSLPFLLLVSPVRNEIDYLLQGEESQASGNWNKPIAWTSFHLVHLV